MREFMDLLVHLRLIYSAFHYFYIFLVISPEEPGASVSITIEEMDAMLYRPQEGEWGESDQHTQCERIICGIDQLFSMG